MIGCRPRAQKRHAALGVVEAEEIVDVDSARTLEQALANMRWRFEPQSFALLGFEGRPGSRELALLEGDGPMQLVLEGGECTLLVEESLGLRLAAARPGVRVQAPLAWVRFELAMEWELVGFLARLTGALAEVGVPLGAVCGYSRDHLFLAREYEPAARSVLEAMLGPESSQG